MASVIKQDELIRGDASPQPVAFNVEDVQARARNYLEDARRQADEILATARLEAASLLTETKAKALAAANQEFEKRVQDSAQKLSDTRCKTAIAACEAAVSGVAESTTQWLATWRNQTVALAARIAEKIVRREMQDNDELLRVWLEEALVAMRDSRDLRLSVHPDDFAVAGRFLQQLGKSVPQAIDVEILPDPQVEQGGCIVLSNNGRIDQQLLVQLDRLVEQLTQ